MKQHVLPAIGIGSARNGRGCTHAGNTAKHAAERAAKGRTSRMEEKKKTFNFHVEIC